MKTLLGYPALKAKRAFWEETVSTFALESSSYLCSGIHISFHKETLSLCVLVWVMWPPSGINEIHIYWWKYRRWCVLFVLSCFPIDNCRIISSAKYLQGGNWLERLRSVSPHPFKLTKSPSFSSPYTSNIAWRASVLGSGFQPLSSLLPGQP